MGSGNIGGKQTTELDFPGYAQEFLRRNPDYRRQYMQMTAGIDDGAPPELQEVMARKWGLNFPLSASPGCL